MQNAQVLPTAKVNGNFTTLQRLPWKFIIGLVSAIALTIGIWYGLPELTFHARLAFITFSLAVMGWIFTDINDTLIAIAAALVFTVVGIDEPTEFFSALGDPLIWLMLTSFIIAAGVTTVGLSTRLAVAVAARTRSVNQLFYSLSAVIIVTAFFIPATSGRAALMLPVFLALSKGINNPRISRALALLFPTIILLSAVASLIGAGAHLVTADIVARMGGEMLNFGRWTLLGLPFAIASCLVSTWVIIRMFLSAEERRQPLKLTQSQLTPIDPKKPINVSGPLGRKEWYVMAVVGTLVLLWSTQSLHGMDNALVALLGALAITLPKVGVIDFKDALKSVEWNMLIFMAATLELGEALIESGGAQWLVERSFYAFGDTIGSSTLAVVSAVTLISLFSHLVINSRTARSSVLVPLVVLLGVSLGYNPVMLAFLSTAAAGFCLTLPVSAKPVTMFGKVDVPTYSSNDLLKLSGVLMPIHFGLLVGFALWAWPVLGLDLKRTVTDTPPAAPTWKNTHLDIQMTTIAHGKSGFVTGQAQPNALCLNQNCFELPVQIQQLGLLETLRNSGLIKVLPPPNGPTGTDATGTSSPQADTRADTNGNSGDGNTFIDSNNNGIHDALEPKALPNSEEPGKPTDGGAADGENGPAGENDSVYPLPINPSTDAQERDEVDKLDPGNDNSNDKDENETAQPTSTATPVREDEDNAPSKPIHTDPEAQEGDGDSPLPVPATQPGDDGDDDLMPARPTRPTPVSYPTPLSEDDDDSSPTAIPTPTMAVSPTPLTDDDDEPGDGGAVPTLPAATAQPTLPATGNDDGENNDDNSSGDEDTNSGDREQSPAPTAPPAPTQPPPPPPAPPADDGSEGDDNAGDDAQQAPAPPPAPVEPPPPPAPVEPPPPPPPADDDDGNDAAAQAPAPPPAPVEPPAPPPAPVEPPPPPPPADDDDGNDAAAQAPAPPPAPVEPPPPPPAPADDGGDDGGDGGGDDGGDGD